MPLTLSVAAWSHWTVRNYWISSKRGFSFLSFFHKLLFFHVWQGMHYAHFTQVPFEPMLIRFFNKSLRFSSVPATVCVNIFSLLILLFIKAAFGDLCAMGSTKTPKWTNSSKLWLYNVILADNVLTNNAREKKLPKYNLKVMSNALHPVEIVQVLMPVLK